MLSLLLFHSLFSWSSYLVQPIARFGQPTTTEPFITLTPFLFFLLQKYVTPKAEGRETTEAGAEQNQQMPGGEFLFSASPSSATANIVSRQDAAPGYAGMGSDPAPGFAGMGQDPAPGFDGMGPDPTPGYAGMGSDPAPGFGDMGPDPTPGYPKMGADSAAPGYPDMGQDPAPGYVGLPPQGAPGYDGMGSDEEE